MRDTLNAIFETYKSKQPELTYRVIDPQLPVQRDLWLAEPEIVALEQRNRAYYDAFTDREISMRPTVVNYNITNHYTIIRDNETVVTGGKGHHIIKNTYNFYNSTVSLQGQLNDLAQQLSKNGHFEEAEEVKEAAEVLDNVKEGDSKDEVKRKGVFNRLKRIVKDFGDKDSTLYKSVEGLKRGKEIVQDIMEVYDGIGQWLGAL